MKSLLFASSCCLSLLVFGVACNENSMPHNQNPRGEKLQAQETIGHYSDGLSSLGHSGLPLYGMPHTAGGLSSGSYDDLHKYGGIGKKSHLGNLYDHGSKGYKGYYGDGAYSNQGLNKYANNHQSDKYGSKSGNHADYHGGHVYTRNRGYGYEKHYMYDKEYSTSKKGGSKSGHHSYYGDHKKGGKSSVQAYKNYGHKKIGAKNGHDDHDYGKYGHLLDNHGEHYLKHNGGHHKIVEHHMPETYVTQHHIPETYVSQHEYVPVSVPVVTEHTYGGALGHGGMSSGVPIYADHGGDSGMLEYDTQHNLHSDPSVMYVSSSSNPTSTTDSDGVPVLMASKAPGSPSQHSGFSSAASSPPSTATVNRNSAQDRSGAPLIPTNAVAPPPTPPVYATIGETQQQNNMRVSSAVHATPAVISTRSGVSGHAHYYNR